MSEFEKRFPKPKDSASVESLYWEKRRQGWFEALKFVLKEKCLYPDFTVGKDKGYIDIDFINEELERLK